MLALVLLASTALSPTPFVPQAPARPAGQWTQNRLPDPPPARTVTTTPTALPRPASAAEFRVKVAATRHTGDGVLVVAVPKAEGTPACFEATVDPDGRALLELEVRGDDVHLCRGGHAITPPDVKLPDARVCAWSSRGVFQLDAVQHDVSQPTRPAPRPPAPVVARAKADPLVQLAKDSRWNGRFTIDQKELDCVLVVVERTATTLVFRVELENGARYRMKCRVDGGKLDLDTVAHTKSATNGQLRIITAEKGSGTVSPRSFALDYSFSSELPNKKETLRGKIRIVFPE